MKRMVVALLVSMAMLLASGCATQQQAMESYQSLPSDGAEAPSSGSAAKSSGDTTSSVDVAWDRYVIRTADLALVVTDVETATAEVTQIATRANGYVAQSKLRRDNQRVLADISIQVPAASLDTVVADLRKVAVTVETENISSQDVTEEFVDNEARLGNLRAAEASTQRLLDQSTKMEDILSVQRELTTIRGEIEKIEGRQNYLKRRVDMSTITIHLSAEATAMAAATRTGWQPLNTALVAWEESLTFISQAVDVIVAIVVFLWWAFPLAAIVVWVWRRRRQRRSKSPAPPPVIAPSSPDLPKDTSPPYQAST